MADPVGAYLIRQLQANDVRDAFDSGDIDLNRFFLKFAGQNQFRHYIGTTYIAVRDADILGYVTVSPGQISCDTLPKELAVKLPAYPLPVLRIARLAVAKMAREQGVGKNLLKAMFELAVEMKDKMGCVGIMVDAKVQAEAFYQSLGFFRLDLLRGASLERPAPIPLFLPIRKVIQAIGPTWP
jgi:GNAT superfamily N-acetyltransferase